MADFKVYEKVITISDKINQLSQTTITPIDSDSCELYLLAYFKDELIRRKLWIPSPEKDYLGHSNHEPGMKIIVSEHSNEELSQIIEQGFLDEYSLMGN